MTKKFICVQGSPETPKGSEVRKNGDMYALYINGVRYTTPKGTPVDLYPWQIEGNSCWEEVKEEPARRWSPEYKSNYYYVGTCNHVNSHIWVEDEIDKALLNACNVYRTREEAEDEVKRRESIAKAWWPEEGEGCWVWRSYNNDARHEEYGASYMSERYIGACHKTKEACEAWGKTYAHLFDKRPNHD